MVEGHCAKRYADDARQKCVGKRVVEIIWRADPQNQKNEGVVLSTRAARPALVAVECISKQVFLRFADDAAGADDGSADAQALVVGRRPHGDSDDELICRPKKRARGDEGVAIDLTLESDDEAPATPPRAPRAPCSSSWCSASTASCPSRRRSSAAETSSSRCGSTRGNSSCS